ncbi:YeeE/YedE family protein [Motiliproteus sp. SC1-56]|uniref:YeeE/YedE family protein n=1 Tax=Motiliproteus sp. SC1-56 TaxID=2799565 RepID=UPI001A8D8FE6|nr:YeeE/YedE family protein [Motiliproteus sp. SC1-56]
MASTEIITPLLGGGLIGLAAILLMLLNGRIAGISGILHGALFTRGAGNWRLLFLAGLVASGLIAKLFFDSTPSVPALPLPLIALAGLLVGAGTYFGCGCTSGHGICGIGRLSTRSIAATAVFMTTGVLAAISFHG